MLGAQTAVSLRRGARASLMLIILHIRQEIEDRQVSKLINLETP